MSGEERGPAWPPGVRPAAAAGFTLIEILIGVALVGILAAIAVPTYVNFLQKTRETALIHYLRSVQKGQELWRAETDEIGYSGDFDELEETGYVLNADNFVATRIRSARRGRTVTTSTRLVKGYRLDLRVIDDPARNLYTYTLTARPESGDRRVRWFFMDQTGIIRSGIGAASAGSPPVN